ncbi:YcaO-like family protein [Allonocardiopsis opalescens]|uniref:Ribosomal protein S12 methylthiotransferase accessory factor n=1 Tax=Allonocardiopsis opalescens TaxID=1144618 RepID=A0A2T0Q0D8_9ACTN|nr:YcaO-like family protein [Allonocardiopsis opalescens]PRX97250.1 ribosomal protein S12 methylthiotransferase accessory factor [Allonocardiopsis opalescens]
MTGALRTREAAPPGRIGLAAGRWPVHVFRPFARLDRLVVGRATAHAPGLAPNGAAGGRRVLVGAAAGENVVSVTLRARAGLLERVHAAVAGRRAAAGGPPGSVLGRFDRLRAAGRPALDPLDWPELAGHPEARSAETLWLPGESLTGLGPVLVPAWAVHLRTSPAPGEPPWPLPGISGLGAHTGQNAAARHAVLELLEHDLLARAWYGGAPRVLLTGPDPLPEPLRAGLAAAGLATTFLLLPGARRTACLLCCLHDPDGRWQTFGARALGDPGAAPTAAEAARSAVYEALLVRWSLDSPAARAVADRLRAGRGSRLHGPLEHALHAFRARHALDHLARGAGSAPWPGPGGASAAGSARGLARALADRTGRDVVRVDTTAPGVGPTGTVVVRAVAPGARLPPAAEPLPAADPAAAPPHPFG